MRHLTCLIAFVLCLSVPTIGLSAEPVDEFERILLPIMTKEIPGAFGSRWITEFAVHNAAQQVVRFTHKCFAAQIECDRGAFDRTLRPGETYHGPPWVLNGPNDPPGALVYVEKAFSSQVSFSLRVRDLSRDALNWGTEIPVVRESEFRSGVVELLNAPLDVRFRQTLRIYDADARSDSRVMIRVFPLATANSQPVVEAELQLETPLDNEYIPGWHYRPGYAEVYWLKRVFPQLQNVEVARVQIVPLTAGLRYWAFISITNNETQQVTTVTPQ